MRKTEGSREKPGCCSNFLLSSGKRIDGTKHDPHNFQGFLATKVSKHPSETVGIGHCWQKKDSYVPAEGPRTFWTSLDFPSKESTPEKVPASGILSGLGAAKSKETNKPSEQGDPTWPDLNELNNGNGLIDH